MCVKGAAVRVRTDPSLAFEERLMTVKSSERLIVSIERISRSVATEVDIADLEPVTGGSDQRWRPAQ
jgi:hypothetical protein